MKSRSSHDPVKKRAASVYAISLLSKYKVQIELGLWEKKKKRRWNRMSLLLLVVDTKQKFPGNTQKVVASKNIRTRGSGEKDDDNKK